MIAKVRAQIFERACMITGKPHLIQYAVNGDGTVFRRFWTNPVIRGRVRRDGSPVQGRWDAWEAIDGSIPQEAHATRKFGMIPLGPRNGIKALSDMIMVAFK